MINVFVNLKSAGKRRPALSQMPYALPEGIGSLRELITETVKIEVGRYNSRETEAMLLPFLSREQIEEGSEIGKVGFGRIYSDKKADLEKSISTALLAFEDGMVRVLVNEEEVKELDSALSLGDGDILTFIRLTFLAGRLW